MADLGEVGYPPDAGRRSVDPAPAGEAGVRGADHGSDIIPLAGEVGVLVASLGRGRQVPGRGRPGPGRHPRWRESAPDGEVLVPEVSPGAAKPRPAGKSWAQVP